MLNEPSFIYFMACKLVVRITMFFKSISPRIYDYNYF